MMRWCATCVMMLWWVSIFCWTAKSQCSNTSIDAGADTSFCGPASGQLNAVLTTSLTSTPTYQWSPASGLSNASIPNPSYNLSATTSYVVSVTIDDDLNLVANGDFESGNTGFTSDYIVGTGGPWGQLSNPGTYAVNTNPNNTHTNFSSCGDHTTGNGLMLIVNGASVPNQDVWCQTVAVNPNTLYNFSTWATSVVSGSPAILQFSINGSLLGSSFTLQNIPCLWQSFNATWNSGSNTSATICIVNQNTAGGGNDFALDDIALTEVCVATDTVTVTVGSGATKMIDTIICQGQSYFAAGQLQSSSGIYVDTIVTGTNCDSLIITNLTVLPDTLDLGKDTSFCGGGVLLLDATTTNATYLWQDNSTNPTLTVSASGSYMVTVTAGACLLTDTINVVVDTDPIVDLGEDTAFCQGASLVLNAQNANASYLWSDTSMQPTLSVTQSGTYWVQVSINTCVASDTINVVVDPLPVVSINGPAEVCVNAPVLLEATGGTNYEWSTGQTTADIQLQGLSTGTYTVTAINGNCSATESITVVVTDSNAVSISGDSSGCPGDQFSLTALGNGDFLWSTGETASVIDVIPAVTSSYTVSASGGQCPAVTASWQIAIAPDLTVSFDPVPAISPGDSVQLILTTSADQVQWVDAGGISCTDCFDPIVAPDSSTYYVVSAWIQGFAPCKVVDSVFVKVERECKGFVIPNAFSPNGDGLNDEFRPLPLDMISTVNAFSIWNRWGDEVYQSTDVRTGWKGAYKNEPLPAGSYVYYFSYSCDGNFKALQGTVSILR